VHVRSRISCGGLVAPTGCGTEKLRRACPVRPNCKGGIGSPVAALEARGLKRLVIRGCCGSRLHAGVPEGRIGPDRARSGQGRRRSRRYRRPVFTPPQGKIRDLLAAASGGGVSAAAISQGPGRVADPPLPHAEVAHSNGLPGAVSVVLCVHGCPWPRSVGGRRSSAATRLKTASFGIACCAQGPSPDTSPGRRPRCPAACAHVPAAGMPRVWSRLS
jgi:hypothetical protein